MNSTIYDESGESLSCRKPSSIIKEDIDLFPTDRDENSSEDDGSSALFDDGEGEYEYSISDEGLHDEESGQHRFASELTNFIHTAKLNKVTTSVLLSLLRTTCSLEMENIPKTTHALWKKLRVEFAFEKFYYCSCCFTELVNHRAVCSKCSVTENPTNSELCVFSLTNEIQRVVRSNSDVIDWYRSCDHRIPCDIVNGNVDSALIFELQRLLFVCLGEIYQKRETNNPSLNLMVSTDGKPLVKSKQNRTSVWPVSDSCFAKSERFSRIHPFQVIGFLVEIPPPLREHVNNIVLLGLWHSTATPPASVLLTKIVNNIRVLIVTGINIHLNNSKPVFVRLSFDLRELSQSLP